MELQIADILTNEKQLLNGFKVLGIFPFHLKYITTGTHIKLCKIKHQIQVLKPGDVELYDFYSPELQEKLIPLINEYCVTALLNGRMFSWFFKVLLKNKIKNCAHQHILNLFVTIHKLNEPAFFLSYWTLIKQNDNTLLKEPEPS